jgi:hypothetical protein
MRHCIIIPLIFLSLGLYAQDKFSNVEISGPKTLIINVKEVDVYKSSKLSTGEVIKTGCSHGACYFQIEYKGRKIEENIGDDIKDLTIYEFDFGNDGDKELIVINDFMETSYLFIYSYGRGLIEKLFEKEILYYRTVVNKDYIEFYMPSGLDQVWNYYKGGFWEMTPVEIKKN